MKNIFAVHPEDIPNILVREGEKKFRSKQLLDWLYRRKINDPEQMNNLPQALRNKLINIFDFSLPNILEEQISVDGTRKFLLNLKDGSNIEMVIIPAGGKNTLCISSQVGCARNCSFCATARLGLTRNLSVSEIVGQIYLANQQLQDAKLTNLVFMGMGEPLDNYDNVIEAVKIIQSDMGFSFSPRRITVSTCGIVPGIKKLANSGLKLKLAVSLNSALDIKRQQLMPVTNTYSLDQLKEALLEFRKSNPYRITFEYVLIKDFNMGKEDRKALRRFVGDISSKLNLIVWNPVPQLPWKKPTQEEVDDFLQDLQDLSVAITFRKSRGSDIAAACGQLAAGRNKRGKNE